MIGCTVVTVRYAAHARVAARSFLEHHPGTEFVVLVADDPEGAFGPGEPFDTVRPADIGIDGAELHRRALMYKGQGLTCSMKAPLMARLLDRGHGEVVYLDADTCVYGDLSRLGELAREHGLVITPHSTVPHDDIELDRLIVRTGAFNSGLLAVGEGARAFLRWWDVRTARRCIPEPGTGVFNEQAWLDLVPGLFDHHVLRDPGVNVSGFAMHYRDVVWSDGGPALEDGPLRHFHFLCGFDPHRPELLTTVPPIAEHWPPLSERPGLARLAREYADRLLSERYDHARRAPAPYDALPDGVAPTPLMRELYRTAVIAAEAGCPPEPPNAFETGRPAPFMDWLNEPVADDAPGLSRYLSALWAVRRDLMAAFPDVPGRDTAAYLGWAASKHEDEDEAIPAALLPPTPAGGAARPSTIPERLRSLAGERDRLAGEFDILRRSRSWRITAPLRAGARLARGTRRNGTGGPAA